MGERAKALPPAFAGPAADPPGGFAPMASQAKAKPWQSIQVKGPNGSPIGGWAAKRTKGGRALWRVSGARLLPCFHHPIVLLPCVPVIADRSGHG